MAPAPLGEMHYLLLEARYEKVRVGGIVMSCSLMIGAAAGHERHWPSWAGAIAGFLFWLLFSS